MWLRLILALVVFNFASTAETLTGPWRFAAGDRPEYASPTLDDSQWQQVRVPHRVDQELGQNFSGIVWYRIRVRMPSQDAALVFHAMGHAAEVYVDGKLADRYGRIDGKPDAIWPVARLVPVSANSSEALIAVRICKMPFTMHGPIFAGIVQDVQFGAARPMESEFRLAQLTNQAHNVLPVSLGLLNVLLGLLLVAFGRRSELPQYFMGIGAYVAGYGFAWLVGPSPFFFPTLAYSQLAVGFMITPCVCLWGVFLIIHQWLVVPRTLRLCVWLLLAALFVVGALKVEYLALIQLVTQLMSDVALLLLFLSLFRLAESRRALAPLAFHGAFDILGNGFLGIFFPDLHLPIPFWMQIPVGPFTVYPPNLWFSFAILLALFLGLKSLLRVSKRNAEAESEMRSARAIQESLNRPIELNIPGLKIDVCALAARDVGGDFHQALTGRDGALWVLIGDVSGKGLQGALWASTVIGAFREVVHDSTGPADGMRRLNRATHGLPTGMFISALIARITPSGELTYANAGHILPYRNGQMLEGKSGLPLGVFAAADYPENHLSLTPGDRLTFLSDGLMEAKDPKGKLLGFETVASWLSQGVSPAELVQRAAAFGQDDDMTAVEVRHVS